MTVFDQPRLDINLKSYFINRPRVIDICCGAGGTSEGFRQAGFEIICGIDFDKNAANSFQKNFSNALVVNDSIENIKYETLLKSLNLKSGELEVLVASPPCKDYSILNGKANKNSNGALVHKNLLDFIKTFMPQWLFLENVPGYKNIVLTDIQPFLVSLGYTVDYQIVNAKNYSVPQNRQRIIVLATNTGKKIIWPKYGEKIISVKEAIGDLENAEIDIMKYGALHVENQRSNFTYHWQSIRYNKLYIEKYQDFIKKVRMQIESGGKFSLTNEKGRRRYCTLNPNLPSNTITTFVHQIDNTDGGLMHYLHDRPLTPREAARVQTFPDSYNFEGSLTKLYTLIGNAVPPQLAYSFASTIITTFNIDLLKTNSPLSKNHNDITSFPLNTASNSALLFNNPADQKLSVEINSFDSVKKLTGLELAMEVYSANRKSGASAEDCGSFLAALIKVNMNNETLCRSNISNHMIVNHGKSGNIIKFLIGSGILNPDKFKEGFYDLINPELFVEMFNGFFEIHRQTKSFEKSFFQAVKATHGFVVNNTLPYLAFKTDNANHHKFYWKANDKQN